jgi:hypothetical protein
MSDNDQDIFLNMFSYSIIKSFYTAAQDTETNKRSNIEIQYLNWFIEFMNLLKTTANNLKTREKVKVYFKKKIINNNLLF